MNDLQKVLINILDEIDRVCTEYNIPYSLANGSAIGAVRHKGFIPWDDDMDIIMLRKDFERLESVWNTESPKHLFMQTYKSDPLYPYPFAKIRNSLTTLIENDNVHLDINHGVFVDIFLYDYLPSNRFKRLLQLFYAELIWIVARKYTPRKNLRGLICKIICAFFPEKKRQAVLRFFEKRMNMCQFEDSVGVVNLNYGSGWVSRIFPRDLLLNPQRVKFEDRSFLLMNDYDSFLSIRYGDYMTPLPLEERTPEHPCVVCDVTKSYLEVPREP